MQELKELNITMNALFNKERYEEFLNLFEPTVNLALQKRNYNILIDLYLTRSKIYYYQGDLQSCIGDLKKIAEWISEFGQDHQKISYFNIYATVYGELDIRDKYLEFLIKAKDLATELDDHDSLCKIYNNLGDYYLDENHPQKAVSYLLKGFELYQHHYKYQEEELHSIMLPLRLNLSKAYTVLGEFQKAEELFDSLFSTIEGVKMMKTPIYVFQYKGLWYKAQKRYAEACDMLEIAKGYAAKNNDLILLEEVNRTLVEIMSEQNDKDRLIEVQKDYIDILLKIKEINLNQNLMQIEMTHNRKQYESISTKDPLTNSYNRRYFEKNLKNWLIEAKKTSQLIGLIVFDVDYFKQVNDRYGHLVGDDVLKLIAQKADEYLSLYPSIFARFGGDEFVAVVKVSEREELVEIVDCLYELISSTTLEIHSENIRIHISLGVSSNEHGLITDHKKLFKLADDALYEAKRNGRNRYTVKL
ncbi:diguanylate cyclase [Lysinibacillus yapensis]|uniref:Diguanylate cyclase n=1 Tax=Ureibacillus yapensis TaxID=2304605 RepID=A0A396S6W3_9BACL|nr:tetratricopeptide repeat-containing diguanylate cyclase [Lysinibacillus yapensis]RHW36601.1 diguanylate cyclase [Lysinibacillus yapensis]